MNSFVLAALFASPMALADNTAAIAAGLGLICSPPVDGDFGGLNARNNGSSATDLSKEGCYAYAKNAVQDQFDNDSQYDECYMTKETADGTVVCSNTYAGGANSDDIRVEAPAEEGVTYHAWQWNDNTPLEYQWPVEESEDEEEEETGHMLITSAVATAAALMLSQF